MSNLRLLERLRLQGKKNRDKITAITTQDLVFSIINYISKILNTRQGSTLLSEDFGIPDFTGIGVDFDAEDMPKIEEDICNFITKTEPRLKNIHVKFEPDIKSPMHMVFSLSGEMEHESGTTPIRLTTKINSSGIVTVSQ